MAKAKGAGGSQRWQEVLAEASGIEIDAMHFETEGSTANAAECYRRVAAKWLEAAESVQGDHGARLQQRSEEICQHAVHLEGASSSHEVSLVPPEEYLHEVNLATQGVLASTLASTVADWETTDGKASSSTSKDDLKVMGAAAALGGAAGLLLLGPVTAVGLGSAAAYATTRRDSAGVAARKVGAVGVDVTGRVVDRSLKGADVALEEGRKRLLEASDGGATVCPPAMQAFLQNHKEECHSVAAACSTLQEYLPRKRLSEEAKRMRARYPDRIPVICERAPRCDLPDIGRKKFVVPGTMLCGEFKYIVHKQVNQSVCRGMSVDQTIYIYVNGISPKTSKTLQELYDQSKEEDGFLYISYCSENTLG